MSSYVISGCRSSPGRAQLLKNRASRSASKDSLSFMTCTRQLAWYALRIASRLNSESHPVYPSKRWTWWTLWFVVMPCHALSCCTSAKDIQGPCQNVPKLPKRAWPRTFLLNLAFCLQKSDGPWSGLTSTAGPKPQTKLKKHTLWRNLGAFEGTWRHLKAHEGTPVHLKSRHSTYLNVDLHWGNVS